MPHTMPNVQQCQMCIPTGVSTTNDQSLYSHAYTALSACMNGIDTLILNKETEPSKHVHTWHCKLAKMALGHVCGAVCNGRSHNWHSQLAQMALTHRSSIKRRSLQSTCTNGIVNLHKWHWVMCAGPSVMEDHTIGILKWRKWH